MASNNTRHVLVVLLTLLPLYYGSYKYHTWHLPQPPRKPLQLQKRTFLQHWIDVHVGDPSNSTVLTRLCNQPHIKWQPNLVLDLYDANGGIGNVRGNLLDFLFFAIESGSSIMLPAFAARSKEDPSSLFNGKIPFDTFFDESYFITTLAKTCPKMAVYKAEREEDKIEPLPDRYIPPTMRLDIEAGKTPKAAVADFVSWLEGQKVVLNSKPVLVSIGRKLWDGPDTRSMPLNVRRDFGGLLRLHPIVRRLAATVTYNLAHRFQLEMDPILSYYPQAYYGAHLRTESDAAKAGWLGDQPHANFTSQTNTYLDAAAKRKLNVIYTASGSLDDLGNFTEKAWAGYHINVTHKHDLLSGDELEALNQLSWDQQALVDYEVLQRCSYFSGFVKSSFSFNIAITRNVLVELEGRSQEPFRRSPTDPTVAFADGLSTVWGRDEWHELKIPRGAWP